MQNIINKNDEYTVIIDNFEGPLDLLLFLITKNKMNIFDVSLSDLTDKYIQYLNQMDELNLNIASEFIVMAATLLNIKSKKLLPEITKEDEEEITEDILIQRLIDYKKYKEISSDINLMYNNNFGSFSKPIEKINFNKNQGYTGDILDLKMLKAIYVNLLSRNENKINYRAKEVEKLAVYEKVTVKDKVNQILNYLKKNKSMVFNKVFDSKKNENIEVVTAFLGILELSKSKEISINQEEIFSDIHVIKNV
jgi:segregation and condensation protein A